MAKTAPALLICFSLLVFAPPLVAGQFWALGSFKSEANALAERARLRSDHGLAADVMRADSYYRVVVPRQAADRNDLESLGFSPWGVTGDVMESSDISPAIVRRNAYYRVLASFIERSGADSLARKLSDDGVVIPEIIPADLNSVRYYRVVTGPFDSKDDAVEDLSSYGITTPWWLTVQQPVEVATGTGSIAGNGAEMPTHAPMYEPEAMPPVEVSAVAAEPVSTITPPEPSESLVDYCLKRANPMERAVYCENAIFTNLGTAQMRAGREDKKSLLSCVFASKDAPACRDR